MEIEYDLAKDEKNRRDRGLSFKLAHGFDFDSALIVEDTRNDYGEPRYLALGYIGNRLHALVFTPREAALRIISLRKANSKEIKRYEQNTKS
jgi:uncharacterized DUF497 family protein